MNAFEIRKYLMGSAKSIMDEADDRMNFDVDPLTGEDWVGSKQLFYLKYKTLLDWAGKSNDPIPVIEVEVEPEDTPEQKTAKQLDRVVGLMVEGVIDMQDAKSMIDVMASYMTAKERMKSEAKLDEVTSLVLAMGELANELPD